jgi:hypothetical protein
MGGPMTRRDDQPVKPWTIERLKGTGHGELQTGAYGDVKQSIIGVVVNGVECMTQKHFWRVEQTPKSAAAFDLEGLTFDGEAITRTRVNNCTQEHSEAALNDWEWHITQDIRRRSPVADPARVAELRQQVRIDVERDEIKRSMREERERLEAQRKASVEEGQALLISMLADGRLTLNDIDPEALQV